MSTNGEFTLTVTHGGAAGGWPAEHMMGLSWAVESVWPDATIGPGENGRADTVTITVPAPGNPRQPGSEGSES